MLGGVRAIYSTCKIGGTDTIGIVVFQSGMGGLELGLYGLPLLVYPSTRASGTLRKREVGTRPRVVSFYCT